MARAKVKEQTRDKSLEHRALNPRDVIPSAARDLWPMQIQGPSLRSG
jgi:hypothetical protein